MDDIKGLTPHASRVNGTVPVATIPWRFTYLCWNIPKLERRTKNGKVLYTDADKQKGIVYIGGATEYQQYKRLVVQQSPQYNYLEDPADDDGTITQSQLEAAELNETASLNSGARLGTLASLGVQRSCTRLTCYKLSQ